MAGDKACMKRFKNWLITILGGTTWPDAIPGKDVHCHIHFNDQQIKMLSDYIMGGVFFNLRTRPDKLIRKGQKKSANITLRQLESRIRKRHKTK